MINTIYHKTEYIYSEPVYLEPHIIRLTPKTGYYTKVLKTELKISPEPFSLSYNTEIDGSVSCYACFNPGVKVLKIENTSVVETEKRNPFSFLIYPDICLKIPFIYPNAMQPELSIYMNRVTDSKELYDFSYYLAETVEFQTVPFLLKISEVLNNTIQYEYRKDGLPRDPMYTFKNETGSCRDIVQLFMEICKYMNLAARFVSGYYTEKPDDPDATPELHAWAEVYIPGGGWVGVDPTLGVMCHGYHVALSSSAYPELTLPVGGTYRGNATSQLNVLLKIDNEE